MTRRIETIAGAGKNLETHRKRAMERSSPGALTDQNTYELPLYYRKDVYLVSPKINNFAPNPTTNQGIWNIGDWWLNQ